MRHHFREPQVFIPIHPTAPMTEIDHLDRDLKQVIEDTNFAIGYVQAEAQENESLARDPTPDWNGVECTRAEHFANSDGEYGWRAYVRGLDGCPRLRAHLRSKLLNKGWDNAEVVSA